MHVRQENGKIMYVGRGFYVCNVWTSLMGHAADNQAYDMRDLNGHDNCVLKCI